ncbi:MAG: FAD:protein FMN transferase [Myxococcota bacterium]|nr:FAD:protein FMN transferase [Myxococcota bacterium]
MTHLSRRRFLGLVAGAAPVAAAGSLGLRGLPSDEWIGGSRELMGIPVRVHVRSGDPRAARAAVDAAFARMAAVADQVSTYRPEGQLARLNRTGRLDRASDGVLELLQQAARLHELGGGAFDVTAGPLVALHREHRGMPPSDALRQALGRVGFPGLWIEDRRVYFARSGMAVSVDGIGKGFVLDQGADLLRERGFLELRIEAGADGIDGGRAVARSVSSGPHPVLDPRTGAAVPPARQARVVARRAVEADGLSTLALVLGPAAVRRLESAVPGAEIRVTG